MTETRTTETRPLTGAGSPASQQVSWWPTHEFITALVANANNLPIAGTPAWCALSDTDPAKLIALAAAGEHHVLRVETAQAALGEASKAVASVPDWRTRPRGAAYIQRRKEIA
ncbi:DUF2742 domain-containing protein [Mycobacterium adipatum]|uniref:DUF2742 domain-containing protein n=1 Tax=Mycobacterium adipatum TaxID=1682113 RepID=UPI0034E0B579